MVFIVESIELFDIVGFGKRLQEIADKFFDGKQKAFAKHCGVNYSQLNGYINAGNDNDVSIAEQDGTSKKSNKGKYGPNAIVLRRFAEAGFNVNWLLTGEGEMVNLTFDDYNDLMKPINELDEIKAKFKKLFNSTNYTGNLAAGRLMEKPNNEE